MKYMVRRHFMGYPSMGTVLKTHLTMGEAIELKLNPKQKPDEQRDLTKKFGAWFDRIVEQPE